MNEVSAKSVSQEREIGAADSLTKPLDNVKPEQNEQIFRDINVPLPFPSPRQCASCEPRSNRSLVPEPADAHRVEKLSDRKNKKSQGIWTYHNREPDDPENPAGKAYIYTFKLKDKYNNTGPNSEKAEFYARLSKQTEKLFPAVQMNAGQLLFLDWEKDPDQLIEEMLLVYSSMDKAKGRSCDIENAAAVLQRAEFKFRDRLRPLGYGMTRKDGDVYLHLPDKKTLARRWGELQKELPGLPGLGLISSKGVASNLTFVQAFVDGHLIISPDEEFIHDFIVHGIAKIFRIFESLEKDRKKNIPLGSTYNQQTNQLRDLISERAEHIESMEESQLDAEQKNLLQTFLGQMVDIATASDTMARFSSIRRQLAYYNTCFDDFVINHEFWSKYISARFDNDCVAKTRIIWLSMQESFRNKNLAANRLTASRFANKQDG